MFVKTLVDREPLLHLKPSIPSSLPNGTVAIQSCLLLKWYYTAGFYTSDPSLCKFFLLYLINFSLFLSLPCWSSSGQDRRGRLSCKAGGGGIIFFRNKKTI